MTVSHRSISKPARSTNGVTTTSRQPPSQTTVARSAAVHKAKKLGHGKGYVYPHDEPGHWTDQEYRPVRYRGNRYYEPSEMGDDTKDWTPGSGPAGPSRRDPSTG